MCPTRRDKIVCLRYQIELQAGFTFYFRPFDNIGMKYPVNNGNRQDIHPAATIAVLMAVGIKKVSIEHEAQKFIVKAKGIVSKTNGLRCIHQFMNSKRSLVLMDSKCQFVICQPMS